MILLRSRYPCIGALFQSIETGCILKCIIITILHDFRTIIVFVAIFHPTSIKHVRLRISIFYINSSLFCILKNSISKVTCTHLMFSSYSRTPSPRFTRIICFIFIIKCICLSLSPYISLILCAIICIIISICARSRSTCGIECRFKL